MRAVISDPDREAASTTTTARDKPAAVRWLDDALYETAWRPAPLPLPETTEAERHPANVRTPVFIGHGDADGVVPMARGQQAYAALSRLGQPVEWHDYPIDHSVCEDEIDDIAAWLRRVWSST